MVKTFWQQLNYLLRPVRGLIKQLLAFMVVIELLKFVSPYLLKLIIDRITSFHEADLGVIMWLVAGMFVVNQITSIVTYYANRKSLFTSVQEEYVLLERIQKKMVSLGLDYHERENTGTKISKIQRGVYRITNLLDNLFWDVVPTVIQVTLTTAILYIVDWRFGLIFTLFIPLFVYITFKLNRDIDPVRNRIDDNYERAGSKLVQSIINIKTVKAFVRERYETKRYLTTIKAIRDNFVRMFDHIFKYNLGRDFIIYLGEILVIVFGVYMLVRGEITIGSLVFIITISQKALISLYRISRLYDKIMETTEAVKRIYALLHEKDNVVNPKRGLKPAYVHGIIKFRGVSFSYDETGGVALRNITLTIPADSVTALVGPSGGGKTTVTKLICRYYDPQRGRVLFDGRDIREYDLGYLRRLIAVVPQEIDLFDASVRDNIAYADPKASRSAVEAAAKIANAHAFIMDLPKGYDTLVGERGIKLSGGQRQRIGIARAVLANPKILIFDEATSHLDSESEKLIQEALAKISRGRTMIIIAHRLSTIQQADKIVVLENGRIVEEGNHLTLSQRKGGLYAKLLKLQNMGDID